LLDAARREQLTQGAIAASVFVGAADALIAGIPAIRACIFARRICAASKPSICHGFRP
jgi:hypothetical protein